MLSELKRCPWCGDALMVGRVVEGDTFRWRRVQGCCADGPEVRHDTLADDQAAAEVDSQQRAIKAWNTRSTQPPAVGVDEAAVDLLIEVSEDLESVGCYACIGSMAGMEDLHGRIAQYLAALRTGGGADHG